ncbi:prepilin peptidase [Thiohalocapsa marina]|uniref:Prepilin leader peptidase/N-methyltransferase n=1 Tax=Thiohalocapsa marina TaxID=424902 RepID=A0A5M8FRA2_9GAMM|nr:A24 family peptidase [Thiohalocapsa marina]KAA6186900.1 prepilin peptidase [Thiohalocapsa marina]
MQIIDELARMPALLYGATLALGLVVGSFLNVLILRLPRMMEQAWWDDCAELTGTGPAAPSGPAVDTPGGTSGNAAGDKVGTPAAGFAHRQADSHGKQRLSLSRPGSHCPHCGHRIRPWENIPLLSFLLLRGQCSHCGQAISWRYPLVELGTALLSLVVVWHFGPTPQAGFALLLTWGLVALAVIDADTQLLPDDITLPLLWLGLLLSLWGVFVDSQSAILGAVAGYLCLWLVFHLFRVLTGKEGIGRGDFKLLALFGAWLGWQSLPQILLLSTIPGALFGIALMLTGRSQRDTPIPFGPFLALAGWVSLIWGDRIVEAYLRFSGLA